MTVHFTEYQIKLMHNALGRWGLAAQIGQTIEECAELIVALQKYTNRPHHADSMDNILDEIADVEMMLAQLRIAFCEDDATYHERLQCKFEKLHGYLSEGGSDGN